MPGKTWACVRTRISDLCVESRCKNHGPLSPLFKYQPEELPDYPNFVEYCGKYVSKEIREACAEWVLSEEKLERFMALLLENIQRGLSRATHADAIVKCFVTYVQDLPNGTESGKFLALDLGGTNFRVLLIELFGNGTHRMESMVYAIAQEIMTGPGDQLFDHIAKCLAEFIEAQNLKSEVLPLGFTFSFPLQQLGLTKGILERWTKGFSCSGVVGVDVVQLLKEAIERRGDVKIKVCAVLNDTTGTLMSCAWKNHHCKIGLIVGTGTNACYVEKIENAELFDGPNDKPYVIINTEWGAFGDDGSLEYIRNEHDNEIDRSSINPGKQLHEKMISGMYMGELARLTLMKCIKLGLLFGGQSSEQLDEKDSFKTKYISEIEAEKRGSYVTCREILNDLGICNVTDQDLANVRYICEVVSARGAHMVSAGLATLINKINDPRITVGIDGSVYRFHPHFHSMMMAKMSRLVKPGINFDIMLSEDGSGRGAALVAAVAERDE